MTIRVLIVDDHPIVRDGLAAILGTQPDLEVAGHASNGQEALRHMAAASPDVVLMDLQMPQMDGVKATAAIKDAYPDVRVLVLTTYATDADITSAIAAGAEGYVLKQASRDELCDAIRTVAAGGSHLSAAVASKVLDRMRGNQAEGGLSSREIEVLTALARGRSNKQISQALNISQATVKTHLLHIYTKLNVTDRTAAVTSALERGIIRLG
jgi:DNA-binding NarL/FixJ family response regulator